jgi:hypothetical protein
MTHPIRRRARAPHTHVQAKQDLGKASRDWLEQLADSTKTPTSQLKFIVEAWNQVRQEERDVRRHGHHSSCCSQEVQAKNGSEAWDQRIPERACSRPRPWACESVRVATSTGHWSVS